MRKVPLLIWKLLISGQPIIVEVFYPISKHFPKNSSRTSMESSGKEVIEVIKRAVLAALGAVALTREKIQKFVDDMVRKGEIQKEEVPEFAKSLFEATDEVEKELRKRIDKAVSKAISKFRLPTRADIERIEKAVEELKKKMK